MSSRDMRIPFGRPMIGRAERAAVMAVLDSPILAHGPVAKEFEEAFAAFTGAEHAISVSSCTAGMHLIYHVLGIGPNDEVLVPAQTHVATAHAVELTGATAVFVDVTLPSGNMDVAALEAAITPNTKAIAVLHFLGVPADMEPIIAIAHKHDLFVIEDCALALGSRLNGRHVGLFGNAGVFSFYPVKHITTAEGGMIILNDPHLAEQLELAKAFGVDRSHVERRLPGRYDAVALGFNCRLSELHAALGVAQMPQLPQWLAQRARNHSRLSEELDSITGLQVLPQPRNHRIQSSCYCLSVLLGPSLASARDDIILALNEKGVGTSIYYPAPVPGMTYYRDKYGLDDTTFPNAKAISDRTIALPVAPHVGEEEVLYMAEELKQILGVIS